MYSFLFNPFAEKQFKKLNKELQRRILEVLGRIKIRPHHFVKRLVGSSYYRLRVGDYRIVLDIQNDKLIIVIIELGHRKNIYK
ncbi:MAG: type II toxin-antitoxin system RelE/ParE family toxin [Nanoarchaeota archaeon]|mgnify:CR=1 FL=1